MAKRDYYEILGISKSAGKDEIKKAYRKMAIKYHPDKNPGDTEAETKFKEAAEAYEILSDDTKRAQYDRFGHAGVGSAAGGGFGGGGVNMEDIFSNFGDIFGEDSPFESFFGGGGRRRQRTSKGSNLKITLRLNLQEIAQGVKKDIKVKKYAACGDCGGNGARNGTAFQKCRTCGGAGQVNKMTNTFIGQMYTTSICPECQGAGETITASCATCKGEGRYESEETISINIPAGVYDGVQLSMSGKGNAARKGGVPGDLIIAIEEIEDDVLKRDGDNIVYDMFISFPQAALGTEVEVPTVSGKSKITIPAGTQGGRIFRLKGKGIPNLSNGLAGDQLVHVNIWVPQKLTREEKEMLQRMDASEHFTPDPSQEDKSFFDKVKEMFN